MTPRNNTSRLFILSEIVNKPTGENELIMEELLGAGKLLLRFDPSLL